MHNIELIKLPSYLPTLTAIKKLSSLGNVTCLSGGWGQKNTNEFYDILSAAPSLQLHEQNKKLHITDEYGQRSIIKNISSFDWLENYFKNKRLPINTQSNSQNELPYIFGFIGYASYDYGKQFEKLPETTIDDTQVPDFRGGIYHWNLINDKKNKVSFIAFEPRCSHRLKNKIINSLNNQPIPSPTFSLTNCFQQDTTTTDYKKSFRRIQRYINEGDCYQINYAHRHQAQYKGNPALAYSLLLDEINTPYSAYLQFDDHQILSLSPERFILIDNNHVETKPIKGTIHRGNSSQEDKRLITKLSKSIKDKAENLMIVDLLRNDLNRSCLSGTVKVEKLFEVESYPNVHHLVSTITGEISNETSPLMTLKKAFPGGSITGAPKIRAMEIIEELESHRRSIYCGSIFYMTFDGNMDSNICIRTLLCKDETIYCWGGGGIVADSNCEDEYKESITKVKNLMDILEDASNLK